MRLIDPQWWLYIVLRLAAMVFLMFPVDWNLATARLMGCIWFRLMRKHRQRGREHLRLAFGEQLSEEQIRQLTLGSMQQLTMMVMEMLFTPRLINEWTWPRYVRVKNIERALDLLTQRRGAILVTGHYGSWELCGYVLATLGFPVVAVMRPLDNPYFNAFLVDVRAKRGLELLDKKGASRSADDILANGGTLAFIADQNAGHKGMFVDFFGVKASTYKSIGLLAMQHQVPIIVGYARRTSPRFQYEVGVSRIIMPEEWRGRDDELRWITQEYNLAIEAFVREAPEQYLWLHRRWKSRPKGEDKVPRNDAAAQIVPSVSPHSGPD